MTIGYKTKFGKFYNSSIEDFLKSKKSIPYQGRINLIFTSPPFPLNRKKKYGNLNGEEYVQWLSSIFVELSKFLKDDGSIIIELGNSWNSMIPTMSTLSIEALLSIMKNADLHLCQQFIWYNTAKLPSPAQWVNVERVRVKDSFTNIWWLSKTPFPKANNKNILQEYSKSMKNLLKRGKYNSGRRPSEHHIGEKSFLNDNNGAIPSNVLVSSNTNSASRYYNYCKKNNIEIHPARMPIDIPTFFIKFLTDENDIVMDPFGGSNTTGEASEKLSRKWVSIEVKKDYILGSKGRFINE